MAVLTFIETEEMKARKFGREFVRGLIAGEAARGLDFDAEPQVESIRNLDVVEIAKMMRVDINTAKKAGDLPNDMKVSVRTEKYSPGQSINVAITALNFNPKNPDYDINRCNDNGQNDWLSVVGRTLLNKLEEMMKEYHWSEDSGEPDDYYECNFSLSVGYKL